MTGRTSPVGVCTWVYGTRDLPYVASRLAALGMDGAEVFVDPDRCDPSWLRRVFEDHGLRLFSCTPHNVDLAHSRPEVRATALRYYFQLVDLAAEAGVAAITCHEFIDRDWRSVPRERVTGLYRLAESLRQLAARAAHAGVTVAYEPLSPGLVQYVHTAADAMALADAVDSPAFKIVLDTYHMHRAEADPVAAIRRCGDRLFALQFADSTRGAIGSGDIDFDAQLRELAVAGFAGPMILECTTLAAPGVGGIVDEQALEAALRASRVWLANWTGPSRAGRT